MLNHRYDIHEVRLGPGLVACQFCKSNKLLAEKGSDENAGIEKGPSMLAHRLNTHTVVEKGFSLTDRALVVYSPYPLDERFVKSHFPNHYPLLFRLSSPIARERTDLVFPPVFKSRYRQNGKIVPFHGVVVFGRIVSQPLHKSEQVNPGPGLPQAIQ